MGVFPLVRQGVLGVTTVFSVIELAISAHLISQTEQYFSLTATFCALAVAVSVVCLVSLPVMLVVDFLRRGAFTSMIVVELAWLFILWVLWVAAAAETISGYNLSFPFGCIYENSIINGMCQETQAIAAFSFLNFIILLLYAGVLIIMAVIAATRGQGVWLSSVKESFGSSADPVQHPMTHYNPSVTPQTQVDHPIPIHHHAASHTHPSATPATV